MLTIKGTGITPPCIFRGSTIALLLAIIFVTISITLRDRVVYFLDIQLKPENDELSRKFRQRACSVFTAASKKAGRARIGYLKRSSIVFFFHLIMCSKFLSCRRKLKNYNRICLSFNRTSPWQLKSYQPVKSPLST